MSALTSEHVSEPQAAGKTPDGLALLLLVRAACEGGATRAEIVRDLAPLFAHKLSPAEWRQSADAASGDLLALNLATEKRGRLRVTDQGAALSAGYLGLKTPMEQHALPWADVRDISLVAKALGAEREAPARLKSLSRPEALCAIIVQQAFGLPIKKNEQPARLRARLALIALERAFGNKIKAGMGSGAGLSAKAGRTLAGQLQRKPREFPNDAKLIAELAAEQVDAPRADLEQLRLALLKRLGTRALEERRAANSQSKRATIAPPAAMPVAANDAPPMRPDMGQFARTVQAAARTCADGWPGNRKAFISNVWSAVRLSAPQWGLSEIEFKCMLAEAHRSGEVVLASADLKDKKNIKELESSAILYKNTVWHFVRVED
ncbi:MAG: hypothetical protein Q7T86_14220 [Hyphomicrobiaceae bacterium]|nr:hypothetical protein [Hyphomicrobiaceae bacterium]